MMRAVLPLLTIALNIPFTSTKMLALKVRQCDGWAAWRVGSVEGGLIIALKISLLFFTSLKDFGYLL